MREICPFYLFVGDADKPFRTRQRSMLLVGESGWTEWQLSFQDLPTYSKIKGITPWSEAHRARCLNPPFYCADSQLNVGCYRAGACARGTAYFGCCVPFFNLSACRIIYRQVVLCCTLHGIPGVGRGAIFDLPRGRNKCRCLRLRDCESEPLAQRSIPE